MHTSVGAGPWRRPALLYVAVGPAVIAYRCWRMGVQRVASAIGGFFIQPHAAVCCAAVSGLSGRVAAALSRAGISADRGRGCGVVAAVTQEPLASLAPKHSVKVACPYQPYQYKSSELHQTKTVFPRTDLRMIPEMGKPQTSGGGWKYRGIGAASLKCSDNYVFIALRWRK